MATAALDAHLTGITDIETWDEYESIYNEMIQWASDNAEALGVVAERGTEAFEKEIDDIVRSIMLHSSATSDYALVQSAALEKFGDSTGKDALMAAVQEIVNNYGPSAISDALLSGLLLDYDKYVAENGSDEGFLESLGIGTDTESSLIGLSRAQSTQEANKSRTNAVKDLMDSMSEDMTTN
jgi:hypothetical protein